MDKKQCFSTCRSLSDDLVRILLPLEFISKFITRINVDEINGIGEVLIAIFLENRELCLLVPQEAIWTIVKLLNSHRIQLDSPSLEVASNSFHVCLTIMDFLNAYVTPDGVPVKGNQSHLFNVMANPQFPNLFLKLQSGFSPDLEVSSDELLLSEGYSTLRALVNSHEDQYVLHYFEKVREIEYIKQILT